MKMRPPNWRDASTPNQLITDIALHRYDPPLNKVAGSKKSAPGHLGTLLLFLDFDAELLSGGVLSFLENPVGCYLDHTIEMFHRINATETEAALRQMKAVMDKHGATGGNLRSDAAGRGEYSISTFSERHGNRFDSMLDEIRRVPGKLYTEPGASEDAYPLITTYVAEHFESIVSELEQIEP